MTNAVPSMDPPTSSPATTSEPARDRVLVVFDFDWSLINEDSDLFVLKELYPELLDEMYARHTADAPWIPLMDDLFRKLAADKPHVGERAIREALGRVPIMPRMLDAVRLAGSQPNALVVIVSGGNSVLIESVLDHHELTPYVGQVIANPAVFEHPERLRVRPYHDQETPHGCALCPVNMCKGIILDRIRQDHASDRILYVGDGTGDYCPATRLTRTDKVLARDGDLRDDDAEGSAFGLLAKLRANSERVQAAVVPWRSGEDVLNAFSAEFGGSEASLHA